MSGVHQGLGLGSHYLVNVLYLKSLELAPASAQYEPAMSRQLQLPVLPAHENSDHLRKLGMENVKQEDAWLTRPPVSSLCPAHGKLTMARSSVLPRGGGSGDVARCPKQNIRWTEPWCLLFMHSSLFILRGVSASLLSPLPSPAFICFKVLNSNFYPFPLR